MADAQAIPDNLFDYSDQCTNAAADLSTWIRTTLTPAIELYQETAIDLGNAIAHLTVRTDNAIDAETAFELRLVNATDARVRVVGQAFMDAADGRLGTTTMPSWWHNHHEPGASPHQYGIVTTDDGTVGTEIANAQQAAGGAQLAATINNDYADRKNEQRLASDLQQLLASENDPAFAAAFLNNLDPNSLLQLLAGLPADMAKLYLAALSSGKLSPAACNMLVDAMSSDSSAAFDLAFFSMLSKNPKLAAAFFGNLDTQHMHQLLSGDFAFPHSSTPGRQTLIFKVLLGAAKSIDNQAELTSFFQMVSDGMRGVVSVDGSPELTLSVDNFIQYCVVHTIPPPGKVGLDIWATGVGNQIGSLLEPWSTWIINSEAAANNRNSLIESIALDSAESFLALVTIEAPALAIAFSAGSNLLTTLIGNAISGYFNTGKPVSDSVSFDQAEFGLVAVTTVFQLLVAGDITDASGHHIALTVQNLEAILSNPGEYQVSGLDGAGKSYNSSVYALLEMVHGTYAENVDQAPADAGA